MGFLYRLEFSNGKSYIGVTTRTVSVRFRQHRAAAEKYKKRSLLYSAWRKHGEPACRETVEIDDKLLPELETFCVQFFNTMRPEGYNSTPGGEIAPSKIPEVAAKISASLKGNPLVGAASRGVPHSAERRAAHSEAMQRLVAQGRWKGNTGTVWTAEQRARMSVIQKQRDPALFKTDHLAKYAGRPNSAATRAKISAAKKGVPQSPSHKQAMAEARARMPSRKGVKTGPLSDAHKRALVESWARTKEKRRAALVEGQRKRRERERSAAKIYDSSKL